MLKCSNKKRKISPNFNENLPYSHLIFQLKGLPFLPTIGFMEAAPSCKGLRWWLKAVKSPLLQMEVWSLHLGGVRWKILSSTNLKERILYFFGGGSKRCENFFGELYHHSIGISKIRRRHKKEAKFESIFKIKTSSKHEFVSFWEMRTPFGLGPSLLQWTSVKPKVPRSHRNWWSSRSDPKIHQILFGGFLSIQKTSNATQTWTSNLWCVVEYFFVHQIPGTQKTRSNWKFGASGSLCGLMYDISETSEFLTSWAPLADVSLLQVLETMRQVLKMPCHHFVCTCMILYIVILYVHIYNHIRISNVWNILVFYVCDFYELYILYADITIYDYIWLEWKIWQLQLHNQQYHF